LQLLQLLQRFIGVNIRQSSLMARSSLICQAATRKTRSGASTPGTTAWMRSRPGQMTPTRPGPRLSRAAGWRRSWTCHSFRLPRTSFPWLSLRATRSRGYANGPPEDACRRTGLGCIRSGRSGRKGKLQASDAVADCWLTLSAASSLAGSGIVLSLRALRRSQSGCGQRLPQDHGAQRQTTAGRPSGCGPLATH
jgi:hypothetical protein